MYLLLAENNYISSREIKSLLDKNDIKCEVINSSSSAVLLDIAEKISPDIVIIDFDFFIDDSADIVSKLRHFSPDAYILVFVDPDHYGKLHQAIEMGIDNYMVKPIQREDVMLRIKMGLQQKSAKMVYQQKDEVVGVSEDKVIDDIKESFEVESEPIEKPVASAQELGEPNFVGDIYPSTEYDAKDYPKTETLEEVETLDSINIEMFEETRAAGREETDNDMQYYEELFGGEAGTVEIEPDDQPIEIFSDQDILSEPEQLIEAKQQKEDSELKLKTSDNIDDKELFGLKKSDKVFDTSSFEELFDFNAERDKKKGKTLPEQKKVRTKPGKIEYVSFARKPSESEKKVTSQDSLEDLLLVDNEPTEKYVHVKSEGGQADKKSSRILKTAGNMFSVALLIILISLSFFLVQSRISGGKPTVFGYQMYVVLSGSMKPAFDTGSVVFVKPTAPNEIAEGDIITFSSTSDENRLTTHRVVGINRENELNFITRGDANNVNDPNPVAADNLVGRVTGSVPLVGYLLSFVQTRQGLILLIFIPGLLIIILELRKLFKYLVEARVEQMRDEAVAKSSLLRHQTEPQIFDDMDNSRGSSQRHRDVR